MGDCEDDPTSSFAITTKCLAQPVPFAEDFSSWPAGASPIVPSCWFKYSPLGTNIPYIYPWNVAGHNEVLYLFSNAESYSYVALPELIPAIDSLQISFSVYREQDASNAVASNHKFMVGVMTDVNDISTFYPIYSVTPGLTGTWDSFELPLDLLAADTALSAEQFDALRHGRIALLSPRQHLQPPLYRRHSRRLHPTLLPFHRHSHQHLAEQYRQHLLHMGWRRRQLV